MNRVPISLRNVLLSKHKIFGRREYKLAKECLIEDEYIKDSVYGAYQGGSGMLVVTNKRVMLVDKRPFFDYVEHAQFEAVGHLGYRNESLGASIVLSLNKTHVIFRSFNESKIQNLYGLLQFELDKEQSTESYQLSQVDVGENTEVKRRLIKPLRRRIRKHPAWSPHNPIMMGVISSSGIKVSKD